VNTIPFSELPSCSQFQKALFCLERGKGKGSQLLGRVVKTGQGDLTVQVWALPKKVRLTPAAALSLQDMLKPTATFSDHDIFGMDLTSPEPEEEPLHAWDYMDRCTSTSFNRDAFYSQL
jgi:hypothetical protein